MISCAQSDQCSVLLCDKDVDNGAIPGHQREQAEGHQDSVLERWHYLLSVGLWVSPRSRWVSAVPLPCSAQLL